MDMLENQDQENDSPAKRFNVDLSFEFRRNYARQSNLAEVKNISASGALIRTNQPLKLSEKIRVYLSVSGRTRRMVAKVVWISNLGVGLEFQPFNNRDAQIIDDIIYYAT